jgi:3-hydroxybutyryl-CoA dehydrogenase
VEIIGVVGLGTMGAGIAQVALEGGHEVVVNDVDDEAVERGLARIREGLGRRASKLDLDADTLDDWIDGRLAGVHASPTLDGVAAEADVIVEAALEDLGLKQSIFRALDAGAEPGVVLATNTSALSVAEIASVASRPGRVVGLHFFNPAPVMPLVEVVAAATSDAQSVDRATRLVETWGKTTVRCRDVPGFIVNRVNRPFTLEALAMVETGEASVSAIDRAIRGAGFPMGPFELMDLVGIDVNLAAARGIWEGFGKADRFRPSPVQERLVSEERLGRKTGSGFYRYAADPEPDVAEEFSGGGDLAPETIVARVWLAVVAEAWRALGDGIASAADIDTALRLGAGHPVGPFERTDRVGGPAAVTSQLAALSEHGPRFTAPPALVAAATGAREGS